MRYLLGKVRAWIRYRYEKRWLESDPYGYIRFAMGLPTDTTDAEIDAALVRTGGLIRDAGITCAEAADGLPALGVALVEAERAADELGVK